MAAYAFDPELAEFAAMMTGMAVSDDIDASREQIGAFVEIMNANLDLSGLDVGNRMIERPDGQGPIRVRLYHPVRAAGTLPAVLYIHGGAFTMGSIELEHAAAASLAREVGALVVSVEYRLAPEHPFPAALDDCYAALRWLSTSAEELAIDRTRVAVCGTSAGGGLAAALALLARDRGGPAITFQFLGSPELDDRLETHSATTFVDTPMICRETIEQSWRWYLGDVDRETVSPYAAPFRATDLAGLPPAYISAMEFDPLRDAAIHYGLRLLEAGVSVEVHTFPGTFHGSFVVDSAAVSMREINEKVAVLRHALTRSDSAG